MVQSYTKADSWFQKSHEEFGQLQRSSGKFKKLKSDGLPLSKKRISLAETFYKRIYPILLSTTCVKIHQFRYVNFETISHFSRKLLCIFFSYQSGPSKCKFSDFPQLAWKFTIFFMSFFKQKVSFSSKFGQPFSIIRDNSYVLFLAETL